MDGVNEVWKDIPGFEGNYSVSNLGRIRSNYRFVPSSRGGVSSVPEKILRPHDNGRGYKSVNLRVGGSAHRRYIHRLVAESFIQTDDHSLDVNHKDGDKGNNTLINLEWLSRLENIRHAVNNGLMPTRTNYFKGKDHPKSKRVMHISTGRIHECARAAAEYHGIKTSTMFYKARKGNGFIYL